MKLSNLLHHSKFSDFLVLFENLKRASNYSNLWLGLNFNQNEVLCIKVYITGYDVKIDAIEIPQIFHQVFLEQIADADQNYLNTPLAAGSGLTFTFKLCSDGFLEEGFYFRRATSLPTITDKLITVLPQFHLKHSDIENGHGSYVQFKKNRVSKKIYLYTSNNLAFSELESQSGINFKNCNNIEMSAGEEAEQSDFENIKIIALGGTSCLRRPLQKLSEDALNDISPELSNKPHRKVAPGYFIYRNSYSVYLVDPLLTQTNHGNILSSIITKYS